MNNKFYDMLGYKLHRMDVVKIHLQPFTRALYNIKGNEAGYITDLYRDKHNEPRARIVIQDRNDTISVRTKELMKVG